ncbi:MAG: fused MFS/spermidine synthase [Candidatus Sumerlaeia bacterium]
MLVCFFLSGACGLVYEAIWVRMLSLVFGVTVYAVSTVLSVFMGGLALGAVAAGRVIDRRRDALRIYGLLEIGVALYAAATPALIAAINPVYAALYHAAGAGGLGLTLIRAVLAMAVLLPPTALMGATLPVLTRHLTRTETAMGRKVALLYAVNTFGAVAGTVAAGFWLMPALGLRETLWSATALNCLIGIAALALSTGNTGAEPESEQKAGSQTRALSDGVTSESVSASSPQDTPFAPGAPPLTAEQRRACWVFGVSGFTALACEVLWTRLLTFYLNNSVYAFTTMLAVFLFGIAAGSLMAGAMLRRGWVRRRLTALGTVQIGIMALVFASLRLYPELPRLFYALLGGAPLASWSQALALMAVQAALVMLPSTLLFGATFPLAAETFAAAGRAAGRSVGALYGWNTIGSILGALIAGFGLITTLGLKGAFLVLMALNLGIGIFVMAQPLFDDLRRSRIGLATALPLLAIGAGCAVYASAFRALPDGLMLPAMKGRLGDSIIFYREGLVDTVAVNEFPMLGGRRERMLFFGDGRGTSGTFTVEENRLSAYLPLFLSPREVRDALIICLGTGNTLAAPALWDTTRRVVCAEISRDVWDAAPWFRRTNAGAWTLPKVQPRVEDGRTFVLAAPDASFDMIALEPPFLHTASVVNLYTDEFYRECRRVLRSGGVMSQWFSYIEYGPEEMKMLFRTFQNNFPHTYVFDQAYWACAVLVGSDQPLEFDLGRMKARLDRQPRVEHDFAETGLTDLPRLLSYFWMGPEDLRAWCGAVPLITDNRTVVDFTSPRGVGAGFGFDKSQGGLIINTADPQTGEDRWTRLWLERFDLMNAERRPLEPMITNWGGVDPEEFRAAVARERARRVFGWKLWVE